MAKDRGWRATSDQAVREDLLVTCGKRQKRMMGQAKQILEEEGYRQRKQHMQRPQAQARNARVGIHFECLNDSKKAWVALAK